MQRAEFATLALDESNLVNRAKVAVDIDDLKSAEHYWDEALRRYPTFAKWHESALTVLLALRRYDEADALMLEGLKRGQRRIAYAEGYAEVAQRRGDIEEAALRWAEVRKNHPPSWKAYVQGVNCLLHIGDGAAADELAKKATARFPDERATWMQCARVAEVRKDWPAALSRWNLADKRFSHASIDIGIARALSGLGRLEEADERLLQAQRRDAISHEIAAELVKMARIIGDTEEEARRWVDLRRRFPLMPLGYRDGFRRLLEMGRTIEAEEVLVAAIDRFPTEPWPAEGYADIASKKQDWVAATERWATVRGRWPQREWGYIRGAEALTALGRLDEAAQLKARRQQL